MDTLIARGAIAEVEEKPINATVTEADFEKTVAEYLAWKVKQPYSHTA